MRDIIEDLWRDSMGRLLLGFFGLLLLLILALPFAVYQAQLDYERRGCYLTGETRIHLVYVYNASTKTNTLVPTNQKRYECNEGEGGWK